MMLGWGWSLLSALISLKLLTYRELINLLRDVRGTAISLTYSTELNTDFMHLIATFCLVLVDSALMTSEKVPSPNLRINRYSKTEINKLEMLVNSSGKMVPVNTYYACLLFFLSVIITNQ